MIQCKVHVQLRRSDLISIAVTISRFVRGAPMPVCRPGSATEELQSDPQLHRQSLVFTRTLIRYDSAICRNRLRAVA